MDPSALASQVAGDSGLSVEAELSRFSPDDLYLFFLALSREFSGPEVVQDNAPKLRKLLGSWYGPLYLTQLAGSEPAGDAESISNAVETRLRLTAREMVLWDKSVVLANAVLASRHSDAVNVRFCTAVRREDRFDETWLTEFNRRLESYVQRHGTLARKPVHLLRPQSIQRLTDGGNYKPIYPIDADTHVSRCTVTTAVDKEGDTGAFKLEVLEPLGVGHLEVTQVASGADTYYGGGGGLGAVATTFMLSSGPVRPAFLLMSEFLLAQVATVSALGEAQQRGRELERVAADLREKVVGKLAGWLQHEGSHYGASLDNLIPLLQTPEGIALASRRIRALAKIIPYSTQLLDFTMFAEEPVVSVQVFRARLTDAWELVRGIVCEPLDIDVTTETMMVPSYLLAFAIELVRNAMKNGKPNQGCAVAVTLSGDKGAANLTVRSGPHGSQDLETVLRIVRQEAEPKGRSRGWLLMRQWAGHYRARVLAEIVDNDFLEITIVTSNA